MLSVRAVALACQSGKVGGFRPTSDTRHSTGGGICPGASARCQLSTPGCSRSRSRSRARAEPRPSPGVTGATSGCRAPAPGGLVRICRAGEARSGRSLVRAPATSRRCLPRKGREYAAAHLSVGSQVRTSFPVGLGSPVLARRGVEIPPSACGRSSLKAPRLRRRPLSATRATDSDPASGKVAAICDGDC